MAATKRKIGIYTTAGIAAAIIIIGAIFASGIQLSLGSNKEYGIMSNNYIRMRIRCAAFQQNPRF